MSENSIHEGFKITELGPLPEEWGVVGLGEVAEKFIGGGTPSTSNEEYWNGEIHWTTSKKINGIHLLNGEKKITKRGLEESSTHLIPKDNLVIGTRVGVGKVAINKVDIAISQDLTGAFIDKEKYALEFLAYQICTKEIQNIFKGRARGTTIKGIPRDDLKKIPLKIPPLPEQHRIAAVLSAVQDAKEKTGAVIAAAKSLKKSLMRHLFTYGPVSIGAAESVPLVETEIGLVPEGWKMAPLGDLLAIDLKNGVYKPRSDYGKGDGRIIQLNDIYSPDNRIRPEQLDMIDVSETEKEKYKVENDDIIINRVSKRAEGVGAVAIIEESDFQTVFESNMFRVRIDQSKILSEYFLLYGQSNRYHEQVMRRATKANQTSINQKNLRTILVQIPELTIQKKIIEIFSAIKNKTVAEGGRKKALDELFKSLLHNLMTAKIRVNHLEVTQ